MVANFFLPPASGLGDVIVSLSVIQHLIDSGHPTWLISRSLRQEGFEKVIPGLAGAIPEPVFRQKSGSASDRIYNFRDHPLQRDYIWGGRQFEAAFPGMRIDQILQTIANDFGLAVDTLACRPLPFRARQDISGAAIIIPGTMTDAKTWPFEHWRTLADMLAQDGLKVLMVGKPDSNLVAAALQAHGICHVPTPDLSSALDVLSSAGLVISVDTGLMHLACHQGIKTIALFARHPVYLRPLPNLTGIVASHCQEVCLDTPLETLDTGPWMDSYVADSKLQDGALYDECRLCPGERCLEKITPALVFQKLKALEEQAQVY